MFQILGYKKQMRGKSYLLFKSKYVHIVCGWMEVGIGMKNQLIISWYCICIFVHSSLCAMYFHAWRGICTVCLNSIYGKKKKKEGEALRPAASWSNWNVNHVSVGGISVCVCVFVKDPWVISRGNVWPRESCPPHRPAPTLPWQEEVVSLSRREIGSQDSSLSPWGWVQIKHFSMCVVMRSCVLCVRVICQWPPPTSLLTWLSLSPLLMFGCFLLFLLPHAVPLKATRKRRGIPHPLYPEDPC